jgi:hypothetical protein
MSGNRFDWHPSQEEVAMIVGELRPIISGMCERQTAELIRLGAVFEDRPARRR